MFTKIESAEDVKVITKQLIAECVSFHPDDRCQKKRKILTFAFFKISFANPTNGTFVFTLHTNQRFAKSKEQFFNQPTNVNNNLNEKTKSNRFLLWSRWFF